MDVARAETGMARDPVCGMVVEPNDNSLDHEHEGHLYHFCSTPPAGT